MFINNTPWARATKAELRADNLDLRERIDAALLALECMRRDVDDHGARTPLADHAIAFIRGITIVLSDPA